MNNKILNVNFKKSQEKGIEFEISKLESFFEKYRNVINRTERLNFYLIILISEGEGRQLIDYISYNYKQDSIFFISPERMHQWEVNKSTKGFILLFSGNRISIFLL